MRKTIALLTVMGSIVCGCASGGKTELDASAITIRQVEAETVIGIPLTDNRFLLSGTKGNLLASATDKYGNVVLAAAVDPEGKPSFAVFDSQQKATAKIGLSNSFEPLLFMSGKNEKSWIVAGIDPNGLPQLNLLAGDMKTGARTRLSFDSNGGVVSPYMIMESDKRNFAMRSGFASSGAPKWEMTDSQGRVRVRIGIGEDDKPYLELLDDTGKAAWQAK
jgi:hypothetical protein